MKNISSILLAFALSCTVSAQDRIAERTYISTDRDVYVAGDVVRCSAFCVDANHGGGLSTLSSTVYLELHGPDGMVQSAKIALIDGRGGGDFTLDNTLPTGNYKLIAYTAQNRNETGYQWDAPYARTVSVFNIFTNKRAKDGVSVISDDEYASLPVRSNPSSDNFGLAVSGKDGNRVDITLSGVPGTTFSVSVYHDDGIRGADNGTISDFASAVSQVGHPQFADNVTPDFEGEIIRGHISGYSQDMLPQIVGRYAFISTPSDKSDVYSAYINNSLKFSFFTGNIYGDKDIVCEIEGIDSTLSCHIELESPFVEPQTVPAQPLRMCEGLADALTARAAAMQIEKRFSSDTLFDFLPVRDNLLFGDDCISYVLDDYTRFPLMDEVIVEFVSQVRKRRVNGGTDLQVGLNDSYQNYYFSYGSSLMMLDGVPVFDHTRILQYDPLLVETINVYPYTHYIGSRAFEGIVNFVTYKRNLPSLRFNNNVRVVNYRGVLVPTAYTCRGLDGGEYPDYRQTIYWHPLLSTGEDGTCTFECTTPLYRGRFVVRVEGLAPDGTPVYAEKCFGTEQE